MADMMIGGPKGPGALQAQARRTRRVAARTGWSGSAWAARYTAAGAGGVVPGGMAPGGMAPGAMGAGELVKEGNNSDLHDRRDRRLARHAVIVDFWAPWCGPCKTLGPQLEKAVREVRGAVRMVKINIDENPDLAQQMRIQLDLVVYAFSQGRPVDGFVGAVPESQIKTFVKKLVSMGGAELPDSPIQQALEQAKELMDAGDSANAAGILAQVVQHDPTEPSPRRGCRGRAGRRRHQSGRARLLEGIGADKLKDPAVATEVNAAKAALDLSESASAAQGSLDELQQKIAKDANDHQARLDLSDGALRGRRWRRRGRPADREHPLQPCLERGSGAQAVAEVVLRGVRPDRSLHRSGSAQAQLGLVLLSRSVVVTVSRSPSDPLFTDLPQVIPVFPLPGVLLLPGGKLPLNVFEPRYLAMIGDAIAGSRVIGMIQPLKGDGAPVKTTTARRWPPPPPAPSPTT